MFFELRWFVVLAVNAFVMLALTVLNDSLAGYALYACVVGPMLVVPVFYLGVRGSIGCAVFTALMWESSHAVPLGYTMMPFLMLNAILLLTRGRFVREHLLQIMVLSLVLNGLWVAYMGITLADSDSGLAYVWRVVTDWVYSQTVCLFVTWWLNALVRALLLKFRLGLSPREYLS